MERIIHIALGFRIIKIKNKEKLRLNCKNSLFLLNKTMATYRVL